ncbi:GGDEF domain-containing protein [Psychromonas sp. psych-6C06]|uniref:GGDEF domain-containing protein n=1 Tax=Psychromonas sp. psych-6C06 TaxID=2058089 RepID=UPI000C337192|nr:GGDEF domain-containing protein [Psychromonas sp. psych-6C06]PKF62215.1 GGDEF domain-containing protein [Psychromonas sp. psych-6C06]
MDSFPWSEKFITGQQEVDEQHFYLVTLINKFIELMTENKASLPQIQGVYKELEDYAIYHFQEEEQLMRDAKIAPAFLKDHIESHQHFLAQINCMYHTISSDCIADSKHLLDFLVHWLITHILTTDMNMGRQIEKINAGMEPDEAFKSEKRAVDSSMETLVHALNHLFSEVAERNKELHVLNQSLEKKVQERTAELKVLNEDLKLLAVTDQLTNLPNRRFAISRLNILWRESISVKPLSCLMIDVDDFKPVNDTFGHDAGDLVLVELTKRLKQTLRNDDIVCRLGGDEFFVICENTHFDGAMHIAQLLSNAVKELTVSVGDGQWLGSISIGVATRHQSMHHIDELMKMADEGVYLAKQAGKGCIRAI